MISPLLELLVFFCHLQPSIRATYRNTARCHQLVDSNCSVNASLGWWSRKWSSTWPRQDQLSGFFKAFTDGLARKSSCGHLYPQAYQSTATRKFLISSWSKQTVSNLFLQWRQPIKTFQSHYQRDLSLLFATSYTCGHTTSFLQFCHPLGWTRLPLNHASFQNLYQTFANYVQTQVSFVNW